MTTSHKKVMEQATLSLIVFRETIMHALDKVRDV